MERVMGIGGVFLKANDPARLAAWYRASWAWFSRMDRTRWLSFAGASLAPQPGPRSRAIGGTWDPPSRSR